MELINEQLINNKPSIIPYENIEEILNQMNKNICMIKTENGKQGTGFFCKIPFPNKENLLPVLMTNNHIINQDLLLGKNKIITLLIKKNPKVK